MESTRSTIMNDARALATLQALANGTDPVTGTIFPADSPYQHPDTVRALYHAIRALETRSLETRSLETDASKPKQPARNPPGNSGKPWSPDEDAQLVSAFAAGQSMEALAATHGRTRFAIEARLAKLGKVPMPAGMRGSRAPDPGVEQAPRVEMPLAAHAAYVAVAAGSHR
jgi:LmbE family N-acetylglucosaminyl deacetylase